MKNAFQNNTYLTPKSEYHKFNNFIENRLTEIAYRTYNFNNIPPVIGIIVSDQYGNTIMVIDYDSKDTNNYGPIKSYLIEDDKKLLEIDLISMYFSSFRTFAEQTNIKNLSHLEIHGSNIKVQIYFVYEKYMIILFLNTNTDLNSKEKTQIIGYFQDLISKYEYEFTNFNTTQSRRIITMLENQGKTWLKIFNTNYLRTYKEIYLKKHEIIEDLMKKIGSIIQNEVYEYLKYVPEDIIDNISKEIKNKIQDKLFDFNIESKV
ncbi:MAG: hypothetical protein ACFE8L_12930 [Candidatus Hodarchaeota archaeon]